MLDISIVGLGNNVVADCVSDVWYGTAGRPFFDYLRVAGMVIGVYEECFGFLVLLWSVIYNLIVIRLNTDAFVVVCVFGNLINIVSILRIPFCGALKAILQIVIISDGLGLCLAYRCGLADL